MFYEEEEGEGREVREGGTSERERTTILSIERERDYRSCTDMRRRRRRGKEERCGGTKKPSKKQFCQLKPLFQLQKAAFFFVIPLVISATSVYKKCG